MDFKVDESYTPKQISVRVGNNPQEMKARACPRAALSCADWVAQEVRMLKLEEPAGWVHVSLQPPAARCEPLCGWQRPGRGRLTCVCALQRVQARERLSGPGCGSEQPPERARHAHQAAESLRAATGHDAGFGAHARDHCRVLSVRHNQMRRWRKEFLVFVLS